MIGCRISEWKYCPFYRRMYEIRKKKHLEWAKMHGCYEEVKRYYEMQEWISEHVVY